MSAWDAYPDNYRAAEVKAILSAVRAGECISVVGLSGAGKSNLVGFLYHRVSSLQPTGPRPALVLVDGNRAQPRTAEGLYRRMRQALGEATPNSDDLAALELLVASKLSENTDGICLLIDRYDALSNDERARTAGPLRALRDAFKYQLTYVITTRRPLDSNSELAELFYANTLWLGPLNKENAAWSANQYAARRGQTWDEITLQRLIEISWGYPSLLRACCEAYASGCALNIDALRDHPTVQRRVQEFWVDQPAPEDIRRSGLAHHPLLSAVPAPISADSPDLTASEHRLLVHFQAHPGEVCAKDDLIRSVWPEERIIDGLRDDSLAQLIRRLRQKVGPDRIQTIPGRGYRYI